MELWFDEFILDPVKAVHAATSVGEECDDPSVLDPLGMGIEDVFWAEVGSQYEAWPAGFTTDGATVELCVRASENTVEAVGLMWLDFTSRVFPFRCLITLGPSQAVVGFIGQVDSKTGEPPRLPRGTLILPVRVDGETPYAEIVIGRRQIPLVWTQVLEIVGPGPLI